ncbi:hypothetical protein NZNM25_09140 [Nitrosopumilus zosterae]|uniref:Peptidase n=1 Tax=Nitrosopumilus zosterae TaxID=718286 RepID=A0A2S2KR44_9ARCH|nr:hypothetical protein [Nitrosopumilus zosterae]BDQ30444.1 hypothetical protein NZOSNM25_000547 [Nitrosopumilus zosterae]GBH34123.1 hypothetical protein NZNM25_09140 [Nitrosopumilus zosterae]
MKTRNAQLSLIFMSIVALSWTFFLPDIHAEPSVVIAMEKTTYSYCEKLFYTIQVSEITGDPAIIHIRDEIGKGSSAIPVPITDLQTPVPSLIAFEKEIFPVGKYFIDVKYSGSQATAEFNLVDSDAICIPELIKPIMANWLSGNISDGFLIDAFEKYIDKKLINIPVEINEKNVYDVSIPQWAKNIGYWWIEGMISDEDLGNAVNYLIDKKIISFSADTIDEI